VQATGESGKDCDLGGRLALEFLDYEERNERCSTLQFIVGDMPRPLTGVESGEYRLTGTNAAKRTLKPKKDRGTEAADLSRIPILKA
jgi:hypothetical protein